jgi:hypothetical protein
MVLNGETVTKDTAVMDCLQDGVLVHEGSGGRDVFSNCTISRCGGIGYHATHKGFPRMTLCVISNNQGGGFMGDNMFDRGSPEVTDSNIFDNKKFDIYLQRGDDYAWANVYVGKKSSAALAKDRTKAVPNIIDSRQTGRKDAGTVLIKDSPLQPLPAAGASADVLKMVEDLSKSR